MKHWFTNILAFLAIGFASIAFQTGPAMAAEPNWDAMGNDLEATCPAQLARVPWWGGEESTFGEFNTLITRGWIDNESFEVLASAEEMRAFHAREVGFLRSSMNDPGDAEYNAYRIALLDCMLKVGLRYATGPKQTQPTATAPAPTSPQSVANAGSSQSAVSGNGSGDGDVFGKCVRLESLGRPGIQMLWELTNICNTRIQIAYCFRSKFPGAGDVNLCMHSEYRSAAMAPGGNVEFAYTLGEDGTFMSDGRMVQDDELTVVGYACANGRSPGTRFDGREFVFTGC